MSCRSYQLLCFPAVDSFHENINLRGLENSSTSLGSFLTHYESSSFETAVLWLWISGSDDLCADQKDLFHNFAHFFSKTAVQILLGLPPKSTEFR